MMFGFSGCPIRGRGWQAVVLVVALSVVQPSLANAEGECYPTGAPTTQVIRVGPGPFGVDTDVLLGIVPDQETYVHGTLVVTASGPNGTATVAIRSDGSPIFRTATPGTYILKATWRVVACRDAAGNEQYAEAASPPQSITVLARDQKPRVQWEGSTTPGGTVHRPKFAFIAAALKCPNPDLSVDKPVVITLRYSTSGPPDEHSTTLQHTYHCPFRSGPFDLRKRPWGQSLFVFNGASAGATVGRRLHVWIEVTFGGESLASIRVRMTPKGKGAETLAPDAGACATRCARTWTKHR